MTHLGKLPKIFKLVQQALYQLNLHHHASSFPSQLIPIPRYLPVINNLFTCILAYKASGIVERTGYQLPASSYALASFCEVFSQASLGEAAWMPWELVWILQDTLAGCSGSRPGNDNSLDDRKQDQQLQSGMISHREGSKGFLRDTLWPQN